MTSKFDKARKDWSTSICRVSFGGIRILKAIFQLALIGSACAASWAQQSPIPDFYQDVGVMPNRDYVGQHFSESIDPFTGKLQIHYVDLFLKGNGGLDIKVQRNYTAPDPNFPSVASPLGLGWSLHFGVLYGSCSVKNTNIPFETPEGSRKVFYPAPDGVSMMSVDHWKAVCSPDTTGGMYVYAPDGTIYEMTTPGYEVSAFGVGDWPVFYTTKIVDRNGNSLTMTYVPTISDLFAAAYGVKSVVASDGRSVTFNYSTNGTLANISDSGGRSISYTYQSDPSILYGYNIYLSTVTLGGGAAVWSYTYNFGQNPFATPGAGALNTVTYPSGGTLSYKYGFVSFSFALPPATVIISKQDASANIWKYFYTPGTTFCTVSVTNSCAFGIGALDRTTIIKPDNSIEEYFHYGANGTLSGMVYLIGSVAMHGNGILNSNTQMAYEWEEYSWTYSAPISNNPNIGPAGLTYDIYTAVPLMTEKWVNRYNEVYDTVYSNFDVYGNPQTISEGGPQVVAPTGLQFVSSVSGATTAGRTTALTYYTDPTKWIIQSVKSEVVDTIPGSISRNFDVNGNLLSETRYGVTTSFTYTSNGDVATRTDANGNTTSYGPYSLGIPTQESDSIGTKIIRTIDAAGNITSQTDGVGAKTQYTYDGLNRLISIQHPLGNPVSVSWTPSSRTVTRGAYIESTKMDGYGRVTSLTHQDTGTNTTLAQTFVYDALGRQVFASYPNDAHGIRTTYDPLGMPWYFEPAVLWGQPTSTIAAQRYMNANTEFVTDENGNVTSNVYAGWGDPNKLALWQINTPEAAASVSVVRNGLDQVLSVTQAGRTRTYQYDPYYFLKTISEPGIGTVTFARDAVGNEKQRTIGTATTNYVYDARNRLSTITYPGTTPAVTRTYYLDDRLNSVQSTAATRTFTYDANKNLQVEQLTVPAVAKPFTATYAYDANDALTMLTYGSGRTVSYAPDAFGRPTNAIPYVGSISYAPNGAVSQLVYQNGVTSVMTQTPRLWPFTSTTTSGIATLSSLAYQYDNVGNPQSIADGAFLSSNRTFQYDKINRLTSVSMPGLGFSGLISYDGRGNILTNSSTINSAGAHSLAYTYDPTSDLLTTVVETTSTSPLLSTTTTTPITHDLFGNVVAKGASTFSYDDAQRMTCANCATASIAYAYDGLGNRISSTQAGVPTYYMYAQGGKLLWELDPNGLAREYVYVAGRQVAVRTGSP